MILMSDQVTKLLQFPCTFTIKIMGLNNEKLVTEVADIIANLSPSFNPAIHLTTKNSTKGNYLSISATIEAKSQEQLDQIYQALNNHELVKITL